MRMTLRTKITTALVLFGLVPAAIVAYFAYQSYDDYKEKQSLIIGQAAVNVSDRIAPILQQHLDQSKTHKGVTAVKLNSEEKSDLKSIVAKAISDFNLKSAQLFIVDPDNRILFKRRDNGTFEILDNAVELDVRYNDQVKNATGVATREIEKSSAGESFLQSWFSPTNPAEVIGIAPIRLSDVKPGFSNHGWLTVTTVPRKDAYATIYSNQVQIGIILAIAFVLTVVLGWYFGRWLVRPLLEIMEVTHELQEGHLYNRTNVRRRDELGDLATQVNSVVDKWAELISQIRTMTSSVSTASNELNSSSHQLAQG